MKKLNNSTDILQKLINEFSTENYSLRLYVAGMTPNSKRAIANIKDICKEYLENRHTLEIIDVYQQPTVLGDKPIIAAPTLIKQFPLPLKRLIGDMSDLEKVLLGLGIEKKENNNFNEK